MRKNYKTLLMLPLLIVFLMPILLCGCNQSVSFAISNHTTTGGTIYGTGEYAKGETVTLYAIPEEGYRFDSWGDGNRNQVREIVVTEDDSYSANFIPVLKFVKAEIWIKSAYISSGVYFSLDKFAVKFNNETIAGSSEQLNHIKFNTETGKLLTFYATDNFEFDKDSNINLNVNFILRLIDTSLIDLASLNNQITLSVKDRYTNSNNTVNYYEYTVNSYHNYADNNFKVGIRLYFN